MADTMTLPAAPAVSAAPAAAAPAQPASCDVLVIGGGPAGATTAALLAQRGHQVVLLEKAHHPRFHIGESLLPANLPLLEQLGVADQVRAIGMPKWGAEFVSPWHDKQAQTVQFADAWDKTMPHAWQVRRSEFDEILIRHAAAQGAEVLEGCRARAVEFLPDGTGAVVQAEHDDGRAAQWTARWVVDASGRDTLLGRQLAMKQRNPRHNSSALYGHFTGARRHAGRDEGNITVFWFDHGWFWFIPLADGTTSVGAVVWAPYLKTRSKPVAEFFADTIALCPALAARLEGAALLDGQVEVTGNFSYACDRTCGGIERTGGAQNYLLVGDAFTFIDPVFSSGVMLAMNGGFAAADALDTCLREPRRRAAALRRYDQVTRHGPKAFSWFIYRVTNPTMRDLFMEPQNPLRVKEALLSVLAGDIFGKTPIWPSLAVLKGIYYAMSLANLRRSLAAWQQRRANIRAGDEVAAGSG